MFDDISSSEDVDMSEIKIIVSNSLNEEMISKLNKIVEIFYYSLTF